MNSSASPQSSRRVDPWLVAIVLVSAAAGALTVARARNWGLMTDELLYTGMARSIAHSVIPLPQVRGESVPVNQVLFPTLIAPIVGSISMPAAYPVIAALNAIVIATAAIPVYLLTNFVTANRTAARWVAACTVATPWIAFASKAIPDPLAYVAVLWTAYAMVRTAASRPKPLKGDLLVLLAIALSYLARNQFILLVGVWVGVVVFSRVAETLAELSWRDLPKRLLALLKDRPLPFVTFVVVILVVKLQPSWLLGIYTVTTDGTRGGSAPSGIVHAFFNHASIVALGVAGLPLILGLPWLVVALARVKDRVQNDAAVVILLLSCAVLYVGASFDLRFAPSDQVIERYVFYIAPLLLVAMAAFFSKPPKSAVAFLVPAIAGLLLLNVSQPYGLDSPLGFVVNSGIAPTQITFVAWQNVADAIGTSIFGIVAVLMIVLAGAVWWLLGSGHESIARNGSFALLLVVLLASSAYTVPKIVDTQNDAVDSAFGDRSNDEKAWLDRLVGDSTASLVFTRRVDVNEQSGSESRSAAPNPGASERAIDLAFWNGSISAVYVPVGGNPRAYSPLPGAAWTMKPDWETGALNRRPEDKSRVLAQAESNPFFAPQHAGEPALDSGYLVYATGAKATAAWATRGLTLNGWVPPEGATLRVWAPRDATGTSAVAIDLWIATNGRSAGLDGFKVAGAQDLKTVREGDQARYAWDARIPAGGHVDFRLIPGAGSAHVEKISGRSPPG
ncbi:MAG: hypothetical protein JHC98_00610 [Thermoleophilaceae bacterium]|nr:hypothetical protein [Thermoleophilaceae bacterium]